VPIWQGVVIIEIDENQVLITVIKIPVETLTIFMLKRVELSAIVTH